MTNQKEPQLVDLLFNFEGTDWKHVIKRWGIFTLLIVVPLFIISLLS